MCNLNVEFPDTKMNKIVEYTRAKIPKMKLFTKINYGIPVESVAGKVLCKICK